MRQSSDGRDARSGWVRCFDWSGSKYRRLTGRCLTTPVDPTDDKLLRRLLRHLVAKSALTEHRRRAEAAVCVPVMPSQRIGLTFELWQPSIARIRATWHLETARSRCSRYANCLVLRYGHSGSQCPHIRGVKTGAMGPGRVRMVGEGAS